MSSNEAFDPGPPAAAVCPYCQEQLERENDGKFGENCYACGKVLPPKLGVLTCPSCGKGRRKLKNDKLAPFCSGCRYNFKTGKCEEAGKFKLYSTQVYVQIWGLQFLIAEYENITAQQLHLGSVLTN